MRRKILAAAVPMTIAACLHVETIGTIEPPTDASTADIEASSDGGSVRVDVGAPLGDASLQETSCGNAPRATTVLTVKGNLDALSKILPKWDLAKPETTANHALKAALYDSLGRWHPAVIYFRRSGIGAWEWHALVDGESLRGGSAGKVVEVAGGTLSFDATGRLVAETQESGFKPLDAVSPQALRLDLGDPTSKNGTGLLGVTQFASQSRTPIAANDGCAAFGGYPDGGSRDGGSGDAGACGAIPVTTTLITLFGNLDALAVIPAAWDPTKPDATSNHSTTFVIYDSLGSGHAVTVFFRRSGAGSWERHALVDGAGVQGGTAGMEIEIASGTLTFDSSGRLSFETQSSNFNPSGAIQPQPVVFNSGDPTSVGTGTGLKGLTQFASNSRPPRATADGCPAYGGYPDAGVPDAGGCGAFPRPTFIIAVVGNLDAHAPITPAWDKLKPQATSNHSVTVTIHDSLGARHLLTLFFRRSGAGAWEWHALVDGATIQGGTAGTVVEIASGTLTFDSYGKLTDETQTSNFNPKGATQPQTLAFDFGDPTSVGMGTGLKGITQFARPSSGRATQDGCP
jgi:hypothetical protein